MRELMLAAAVGGAALIAGYGTATAQVAIEIPGAGVYIGPGYHDHDYYEYGSRRYGYYGYNRYDDDRYHGRRGQLRSDFQSCGRYSYWDGNACQPGRRP